MFTPRRYILSCLCVAFILSSAQGDDVKLPGRSRRIFGGKKVQVDAVPYIVLLKDKEGRAFCGGSLIAPKIVITAAHCLEDEDIKTMTVTAGVSKTSEKGVTSGVVEATVHPKYKSDTFHSDVAVFLLKKELKGKNIKTIPLIQKSLKKGSFIVTAGWGRIDPKVKGMSPDLKAVRLPVQSLDDCAEQYGKDVKINMFCASGDQPLGICKGDSGGPAVFQGKLAGVNAFTDECGADEDMQGFVDITKVRDFIDPVIKKYQKM